MISPLRCRIAAFAVVVAAAPLIAPLHAVADGVKARRGGCPCQSASVDRKQQRDPLFQVVLRLHPSLRADNLRQGANLALINARIPGLDEGFYLLRIYLDRGEHMVSVVDLDGRETPLDLLGLRTNVQLCKPHRNDIEGCFPETDECVVECDHESSFCVQTCIVADTWPDEFPPQPKP